MSYFFEKVEYVFENTGITKKKGGNGMMEYWNDGMMKKKQGMME
jgi:hypothetical protein